MIQLRDIKSINMEASSKCSARCPFCSRHKKKRTYGGHMITLADFRKLPRELFHSLRQVTFAGNFGDFSTNPELPAIAELIKSLNPAIILGGDTNGMLQEESWWRELGACYRDGGLIFSVDGLADTHALHRVGTDYATVIRNMHAFVDGGGAAYWKFIAFAHNEHQIKTAESIAADMGCAGFFVISSREYNDTLRRPETFDFMLKQDLFSQYAEASPVALCSPVHKGTIYIAADGTVHPCCLAHCMYITEHDDDFRFVVPLIEKYAPVINFKTTPLEEILRGPYFEAVVKRSRKNPYCRMKCNPHRKEIKQQLVVFRKRFNPNLDLPL